MKRKGAERLQSIRFLTDPQPEFVSLVSAGANQTPFRIVKIDGEAVPHDHLLSEQEHEMPKTTHKKTVADTAAEQPARKQDGFDVHAIRFQGEIFTSEEEVAKWLDQGGYEDYAIAKTDWGYEVAGSPAEAFEGEISKIDAEGVVILVGKLRTEAESTVERAETVGFGDEPATTEAKALPTVENAGAVVLAVREGLVATVATKSGDLATSIEEKADLSIEDIVGLATLIAGLSTFTPSGGLGQSGADASAGGLDEGSVGEGFEAVTLSAFKDALCSASTALVAGLTMLVAKDAEAADEAEAEAAEKADENTEVLVEVVRNITGAMENMATANEKMVETLKELVSAQKDLGEKLSAQEERVAALETIRPARKSADIDGADPVETEDTAKVKSFKDRQKRNLLGMNGRV